MPMLPYSSKNQTVIFSGAMLREQPAWKRVSYLLPHNTCLIVINPNDPKLAQTMKLVAKAFLDKGRPVHIWLSPQHAH